MISRKNMLLWSAARCACTLSLGVTTTTTVAAQEIPAAEGDIVVTGVRGTPRTIADSPVPIDVVTSEQLQTTARTGLKEILSTLVPSLSLPAAAGGGTATSVRPYTIRGLSADYLLVLVNGKRRHSTALINNISTVAAGSSPVDLDHIPVASVSRIEVLRDGAAAQYGSDAIAGIINIGLSRNDEGARFSTTVGQSYNGQGELYRHAGDIGFRFGDGGFLNVAVDAKHQRPVTVDEPSTGLFYPLLANGSPDPREANINRQYELYGRPFTETLVASSYNLGVPIGDNLEFYSFGTLGYRKILDPRQPIRPNNISSLPERYPNGLVPRRKIRETDYQFAVGLKGKLSEWSWDASTTLGRGNARLGGDRTLNPSLGPTNTQSSFYIGSQLFTQWTSNLDVSRAFDVGFAGPLNVSFGLEHRWERFQNKAGEPNSYLNGGYIIPSGTTPFELLYGGRAAPAGLVAFTGTTPDDAISISRNSYAAYVELGADITDRLFIGAALRGESYSDSAGETLSGKATFRYEFIDGLALRGGINTGFRAPSLAQIGFSTTQNTGIIGNDGSIQFFQSKFLPVNSPEARLLGADPLKPEKSLNFTLGFSYEFSRRLRFTIDAYRIDIDDRITRTEVIQGDAVQAILAAQGFTDLRTAQYFTNAIDSRTEGVDFVAEYTLPTAALGAFRWNLAYSYNNNKVRSVKENPEELSALGPTYVLFGRQALENFTKTSPRHTLSFDTNWKLGEITANARIKRHGSYTLPGPVAAADTHFGAEWVVDASISYRVNDVLDLTIGADNLFDQYPDKIGAVTSSGWGAYGSLSPFGHVGGFYYARVGLTF